MECLLSPRPPYVGRENAMLIKRKLAVTRILKQEHQDGILLIAGDFSGSIELCEIRIHRHLHSRKDVFLQK